MPLTLPPRPKGSGFSHFLRFARNPFDFLQEAHRECGDVFVLKMPLMGRVTCVASPELSRLVYSQTDDVLSGGIIHSQLVGGLLGPSSTMTSDGEAHKYRQSLVIKYLNGPKLAAYVPMIRQVAQEHINKHLDGQVFSAAGFFAQFSLDVIGRVIFGLDVPAEKLRPLLDEFEVFNNEGLHSPLNQFPIFQKNLGPWSPWGRILRMQTKVRATFQDEVARLRGTGCDSASICHALIEAGLTDGEVVDELFSLLFAGYETTRSSMTWTTYQFLSHPGLREKVLAELDARIGDRPIEYEDLDNLPILESLIHEVLRSCPIGPFLGGRIAQRDFELGPYLIRAGESLLFCGHTIAQRDDVWAKASTFDPERFLDRALQSSPNHFPFGRGRRICTGKGLALQESIMMLAILFQTTEIALHLAPQKPGARFVMLGLGKTLALPITLTRRQPPHAPTAPPPAATEAATCPYHPSQVG